MMLELAAIVTLFLNKCWVSHSTCVARNTGYNMYFLLICSLAGTGDIEQAIRISQ